MRRNEISAKIPVTGKTGGAAAMKSRRGVLGIAVADNRQQRAAMVLRDVHYGVAASVEVLDQEDRDGAPLKSAVAKHLEMFKRHGGLGQPHLGPSARSASHCRFQRLGAVRPLLRRGRSRSVCVVNGRLRHMGKGAVRQAPPCVVSHV